MHIWKSSLQRDTAIGTTQLVENEHILSCVTYNPSGVISTKTGAAAHSNSPWHTDGSYEAHPQRFFGLHAVHPDRLGSGIFPILHAENLVEGLESDLHVPAEFHKGQATNRERLLDIGPVTGRCLLRYRKDILADPPSSNPAANAAIEQLNALL